jgi:hypothetical protein
MTGTTTTGTRAPRWLPAALATGIAALLALALFVDTTGHAAAEESDAVTDEALTDALAGAEATLVPTIALLSQLVEGGLLPADATDALQRVLDRLRDRAPSPGAVGRRAAGDDEAPDTVLERCRNLVNDGGQHDPFALCRRAANADSVPEAVIERCRNLVDDDGTRDPFALCRRAANADSVPETVTQRCREAASESVRLDRQERPDTRLVRRPQVRPDRARLLAPPSVAPRPVAAAGASLS